MPAHSVSRLDGVSWCNTLSIALSLTPAYDIDDARVRWDVRADGFRLPTEAEWEWACHAGTSGPHYAPLPDIAWTDDDAVSGPQLTGRKQPNAFGLYDMLSNVWEWFWDFADPASCTDRGGWLTGLPVAGLINTGAFALLCGAGAWPVREHGRCAVGRRRLPTRSRFSGRNCRRCRTRVVATGRREAVESGRPHTGRLDTASHRPRL
ncbi:formylglycine-generating enzyme family protein [Corynebacterium pacaense]|uniref:formylglycine-generating enzyme family protein n=1 Tax=Corynebacterium pacaense TaxID=1816684 RepID=UPI003CCBE30B